MTAIDKFVKMFNQIIDRRSDQWMERIPAQLGDYAGQVTTGTPGMINVRTTEGQNLVVFNNVAPAETDIWVTIGRSKDQPQLWQVISRREVWDVPGSSSVVHHHEQHMFMAPDMVPIDRKQILQLSVIVYDAAGFVVQVGGSYVPTATGLAMISTQLLDLSSYVVTAGAKFISIESDDDGVLSVHDGVAFGAPEIGTISDIPAPDPGKYHVSSVLFFEGQAALLNEHIRVPFPLGVIAKGAGLQTDEAAADTPLDADKFGFWDVVDEVLKSITWANIKATLKTYFDTLYSALGHSHSAPDASVTTYTPSDATDWTGSVDPGDVDDALNQLADRVDTVETTGGALMTYDDLSAQIPGVASHYDLAEEAIGSIMLFWNTTFQSSDTFTVDGDGFGITLTFAPAIGDKLIAIYGTSGVFSTVLVSTPPDLKPIIAKIFR